MGQSEHGSRRKNWEELLEDVLQIILFKLKHSNARLNFIFGLPELKTKRTPMTTQTITSEQKLKVTLNPKTLAGRPEPVQAGSVRYSVLSGDSTFEAAEDGMSAYLISSDTAGDTDFLIEADADLGEGVTTISEVVRLTVVDPQAAVLGVELSAAEPKDPVAGKR